MTDIATKIAMTGGRDFWTSNAAPDDDVPATILTDGPHGVRMQAASADHLGISESIPATCFPPAVGLASSWSRDMLFRVGEALGVESAALRVGVLLGPGMNIKRSPLCGRNFEYFSEDPHASGELAAALVKGIQSKGIGTSVKHYAANNQETDRMRVSSDVDERTLREIYLRGFSKVVKDAQPWTVMCSYNRVNGVTASENHFLLTEVLRDEWGFEGFVVSDWGAVLDRVAALKAGLDLQMPFDGGGEEAHVKAALEAGEIDEATIDQAYQRIARILKKANETLAVAPTAWDVEAHHALAREAAGQCIVLLKNDGVLPVAADHTVAIIGEFARTPRYQGAGSSRVNPTKLDNALDAVTELMGEDVPFAPGFTTDGSPTPDALLDEAVAVAKDAQVVLAFLGLGEAVESEGYDREHMDLPAEQLTLLDRILEVNPNVVVVLSNGSSVRLPFADRVPAIVEGWLLGQAGGSALVDVLFGKVNPSGKITETIPLRIQDVPSYPYFPGDSMHVSYGEGLFVGYRGYDLREQDVAFPFGHGLSYTTFDYSDVTAAVGDGGVTVELTVTNSGDREGREVVQVYVGVPKSKVARPVRELKGFADVTLKPGASEQVSIEIPWDELAYWSIDGHDWRVEDGDYLVEVGASSRDIRGSALVSVSGQEPPTVYTRESLLDEVAQHPAGAAFVDQLMAAFDAQDLGDELRKMFMSTPLQRAATFGGPEVAAQIDGLVERLNQR